MAVPTINTVSNNGIEELKAASNNQRAQLDREDFMKLFVTQLQYQDPMNPMQSAEMATQVAQFNMVDLMYKNNEAITKLVDATEASSLTESVSFLGKDVTYKGSAVRLTEGGADPVKIQLDKPSASTLVTITDEQGRIVRNIDIGGIQGEKTEFVWDGKDDAGETVNPGTYFMTVTALDQEGNNLDTTLWTQGTVVGLKTEVNGNIALSLDTGETTNLKDIQSVKQNLGR
ncbi:Flagellar basal-body rod modification protein FlgD [Dissulfuribacter thermophilus]|uniref:Basal-body rod modification protein FlgD n=1 Tax=Dissulfuribacter thermophilus TaxID=1156395 RepID=A0A1B9F8K8_9BACT|nr:flagellar hook capping FlgD N-terminal domain-containing protein [Dissulfuribacter thermophilus]OCC16267.1 Flagellar basal-body rod modification protein FlgD [Dissulfuribacter thermophilus]